MQQINCNVELIRYQRYGDELLLFGLVDAPALQVVEEIGEAGGTSLPKPKGTYKTVTEAG